MGQKNLLSGAAFSIGKVIRDDFALTPGSLFLFDPTHSLTGLSGVPANGAALYNVAWAECAAVLGSGDVNSLQGSFANSLTTGQSLSERTAKGGIHFLISQASAISNTASVKLPSAVFTRLKTLTTRNMALFIWTQMTRISAVNSNMREVQVVNYGGAAGNYLFLDALSNTLGLARYSSNSPTGWAGAPNSNDTLNGNDLPLWGNSAAYGGNIYSKSYVLYRVHLVDVAASGMSFAQLNAADQALYTSTFGTGGRLNGDSWSLTGGSLA